MLRRAWFVFAVLWALLWFGSNRDPGELEMPMWWIVALGPLLLPWVLGLFLRFVITGSPLKSPRAVPYRRP